MWKASWRVTPNSRVYNILPIKVHRVSTTQVSPNLASQEEINPNNGYFNPPSHLKVKNEPSSEELFVADFLRDSGLKFEAEVPLYNLHGDVKKFRKADFYLPNLGVYVEYFGQYNATKEKRAAYDKKAEVYIKNSIPTIFIYPHELGFLEYAFHYKMVKLLKLKKFDFKKSLLKYRFNRFKDNFLHSTDFGGFLSFFISALVIFLVFEVGTGTGISGKLEIGLLCASAYAVLQSSYNFIVDVRRFFYKDE